MTTNITYSILSFVKSMAQFVEFIISTFLPVCVVYLFVEPNK